MFEPPVITNGRRLRLRYPGRCVACGVQLNRGHEALYSADTRSVRCVECPTPAPAPPVIDHGTAGGSARQRYERLRTARETRVKARLGNWLGGVLLGVAPEPHSIRAWGAGAIGEAKLATALSTVDGIEILHDRLVPGTRGNIDHLVVAPAGVFVVDAKNYRGLIRVRDVGGLFRRDERLYVGGRDCSKLASGMTWQMEAVMNVLVSADMSWVRVVPVLCFVEGEWPLLAPPTLYHGVRLEGTKSIRGMLTASAVLDPEAITAITRQLAMSLPAGPR